MNLDDSYDLTEPTIRASGSRGPEARTVCDDDPFVTQPTMRGRTTPRGERLRPGDVLLGRYTVLSELGEGGMGVVYKCLDTVGGIEVALKCLPPELSRNESEMEGIRENYALVARLHHSAISGLRQLEKDPESGEYYLVMDLAKGEDLSTILRRRRGVPMPLDEALAILRPLASALDYAHGERVLHRDVKPANVKVETLVVPTSEKTESAEVGAAGSVHSVSSVIPKLRVQLLDFGLAAEVRSSMSRVSLRDHGGASGTPAYMAPEQWEARRQSAATDQYALAVTAYQMLAGRLPFEGDNQDVLRRAVLVRDPDQVENLAPEANAALLRALAKDPKDRFPSCEAFVGALAHEEFAASESHAERTERESHAEREVVAAPAQDTAALEADVLRRKVALARVISEIPAVDRADAELAPLASIAETELSVADEAFRFGRFAAAAQCLDRVGSALDARNRVLARREEATRKKREEERRLALDREKTEQATRKRRRATIMVVAFVAVAAGLLLAPIKTVPASKVASAGPRPPAERRSASEARSSQPDWASRPSNPQKLDGDALSRRAGDRATVSVNSRTVALRWCPPGSFTMGSPSSEPGHESIEVQHGVTLTKGFWMGETEVTQGLWKTVLGNNPSQHRLGLTYPVEYVSWNDVQEFMKALNHLSPVEGFEWRLPTETQWEYACRAGTTGIFGGTGKLDDMGWYSVNSGGSPHPVGQKKPNAWGIYDMHGNVWELCQDWFGNYPSDAVTDPVGPPSGSRRIERGGSWCRYPAQCRSAKRAYPLPDERGISDKTCSQGFRVALVPTSVVDNAANKMIRTPSWSIPQPINNLSLFSNVSEQVSSPYLRPATLDDIGL